MKNKLNCAIARSTWLKHEAMRSSQSGEQLRLVSNIRQETEAIVTVNLKSAVKLQGCSNNGASDQLTQSLRARPHGMVRRIRSPNSKLETLAILISIFNVSSTVSKIKKHHYLLPNSER